MADRKTKKIICTSFLKGRNHDFKLFKESKVHLCSSTKMQADNGYQGLQKIHGNTEMPKKKSKKHPLSKADKQQNRIISSERVLIENIIREIKIFRIIAEKYRNRRKRFAMRVNLIAAFYNRAIDPGLK